LFVAVICRFVCCLFATVVPLFAAGMVVLLLFCSLMISSVAWMVGGRLDVALYSLVCWTLYLWYVVDCLGVVEGPPGFSSTRFTLHHLYKMLLLLTAGVGLLELLFTLLLLNG